MKYLIVTLVAIALGIGMLFMPEKDPEKQGRPEELLAALGDPSRFFSIDEITDRLVKKDPTLLLIDVRPDAQFEVFSIPGAIHIPADSLLSGWAQDILRQKEIDKVFYSNADVTSDQAWIICKRLGLKRIYVMQGGANQWFNDIVKAEKPAETASAENQELYQFRMAARQFFFGSPEAKPAAQEDKAPKKVAKITKNQTGDSSLEGC